VKDLNSRDMAKYFLHGIVFSILFLVLAFAWIFLLLFLTAIGFIIGLIIGFGVLLLIVGFLNSSITSLLWFEVKTSFWDLFFHGLALFIILLVVNGIFVSVPLLVFPGIATTVATLILATFLNGFVGKKVAGLWEKEYREGIPEAIEAEWRDKKL
jgi:hypothetical protein